MSDVLQIYEENAEAIAERFLALDSATIFEHVRQYFPTAPASPRPN